MIKIWIIFQYLSLSFYVKVHSWSSKGLNFQRNTQLPFLLTSTHMLRVCAILCVAKQHDSLFHILLTRCVQCSTQKSETTAGERFDWRLCGRQSQTIIASLLLAWFTAFSHFTCSYRIKIYGRVLMYIQIFKRYLWCSLLVEQRPKVRTQIHVRTLGLNSTLSLPLAVRLCVVWRRVYFYAQ